MSNSFEENSSAWSQAVVEAARLLEAAGDGSLVFHEERTDLRLEMHEDGRTEVVRSVLAGVSVRRGLDPHHTVHGSDPLPEHAIELARGRNPALLQGAARAADPDSPAPADVEKAHESLKRLVAAAIRGAGPGVRARARASWVQASQDVHLARPDLGPLVLRRTGRRVRLDVGLSSGGRRSRATAERVLDPRPESRVGEEELAERATRRARERLDARAAAPGGTVAAFAPGVGGVMIHELVGHALEADTVGNGGSVLSSLRSAVAPAGVVVVDDPRRGRTPWTIDDEGNATRPVPLIREGRVAGGLYDMARARRASVEPTGHGRRSSYRESVLPRMGCTFLAAGRMSPEEVLQGIERGLYVRRMEAAWVDTLAGRATFHVTDADFIERGRRVAPAESLLLTVDTLDALRTLDRVADDLRFDACIGTCVREGQPLATSVGAPTFRIGVVTVAAQEGSESPPR